MKKEVLFLMAMMPVLAIGATQSNLESKLIVQAKGNADSQVVINQDAETDSDKGIAVYIGNNTQIQVFADVAGEISAQYFGNTAIPESGYLSNSVYLTLEKSGDLIVFTNNDDASDDQDVAASMNEFTPVSQSGLIGNGDVTSPYKVTTVVKAVYGTTINAQLKLTDTYIVPNKYFDRKIEVSGLPSGYTAKVFWAADTYLGGDDNGYCYQRDDDLIGVYRNGSSGSIGANLSVIAGEPEWTHYIANDYEIGFGQIENDNDLDDSICTGKEDVGFAVQWDIPTNRSSYTITTGQAYVLPQNVSAAYNPAIIDKDLGETSELKITVSNTDSTAALYNGGFEYSLPTNIELSSMNAITNTCGQPAVVSGDSISAKNITLTAAQNINTPRSCSYTFSVKGYSPKENVAGYFTDLTALDEAVLIASDTAIDGGKRITVTGASGGLGSGAGEPTVTVPSNGLLGLLILVLASIGFGRYYFKR